MLNSTIKTGGSFATLMKMGRQGLSQGKFAFTGSVARIVLPTVSELLEEFVGNDVSFTLCLVMIASSIVCVLLLYFPLVKYTDRNTTTGGTPTGKPAMLAQNTLRYSLLTFGGLMVLAGCVSFSFSVGGALI